MSRDMIPIYGGVLQANRVGSFQKDGFYFDIIRPGYDSQARRRTKWTQFVLDGYPVFEVKVQVELDNALRQFEERWARLSPSKQELEIGLKNAIAERKSKFKDGKTGVEPAPALRVDGRPEGTRRPA